MDGLQLAMFGLPGGAEWIVIGLVALLIFGRRLPDVARSVGKSIVEFKKGINDVKDEIDVRAEIQDKSSSDPASSAKSSDQSQTDNTTSESSTKQHEHQTAHRS